MKKADKYAEVVRKNAVEANDRINLIPDIIGYEIMSATSLLG